MGERKHGDVLGCAEPTRPLMFRRRAPRKGMSNGIDVAGTAKRKFWIQTRSGSAPSSARVWVCVAIEARHTARAKALPSRPTGLIVPWGAA